MSSVVQGETTGACLILNLHRIEKKIKDRDLVTVTFSLFTTVLSQWDFSHGKFGSLSPGKASCDRVPHFPTYGACWMFYCFHNPPNSDMDYGIFNVRTDVNACNCTRCVRTHVRESAVKDDREKNPLPHRGIEPALVACRSDALPTELHPQPSVPVTSLLLCTPVIETITTYVSMT